MFDEFVNPIPLDILRFRGKTMPQITGKRQGVSKWHPLKGIGLIDYFFQNIADNFRLVLILGDQRS